MSLEVAETSVSAQHIRQGSTLDLLAGDAENTEPSISSHQTKNVAEHGSRLKLARQVYTGKQRLTLVIAAFVVVSIVIMAVLLAVLVPDRKQSAANTTADNATAAKSRGGNANGRNSTAAKSTAAPTAAASTAPASTADISTAHASTADTSTAPASTAYVSTAQASTTAAPTADVPTAAASDSVVKSPIDDETYATHVLDNGVKVLLMTTGKSETPALVSVNIAAGSLHEPEDVPGLAHFLQHMIYLGSEDYPDTFGFDRLVTQFGGFYNGFVSGEVSNYHYQIDADGGRPVLLRLVAALKSPLFNSDFVQREMHAVHAKNVLEISSENRVVKDMLRLMADPNSPKSRSPLGSLKTLNRSDIVDQMKTFRRKYYTGDRIVVGIRAGFDLEILLGVATSVFEDFPPGNSSRDAIQPPFPAKYQGQRARYRTPSNDDYMHVYFPLETIQDQYREDPTGLILSYLLHASNGTLQAELRNRGWGRGLRRNTNKDDNNPYWALLSFRIDLTDSGKNHIDDIMALVFQYIQLISKSGITKQAWDDALTLKELHFNFTSMFAAPLSDMPHLTQRMDYLKSSSDLLSPPERAIWNHTAIQRILEQMTPDRVLILVGQADDVNLTSYHNESRFNYSLEHIPALLQKAWQDGTHMPAADFLLPGKNRFLPNLTNITDQPYQRTPVLAINIKGQKLWWQPNSYRSHEPKEGLDLQIVSTHSRNRAEYEALMLLWLDMTRSSLASIAHEASLAGFTYTLTHGVPYIHLSVRGYADVKAFSNFVRLLLEGLFSNIEQEQFSRSQAEVGKSLRLFGPKNHLYRKTVAVQYFEELFFQHPGLQNNVVKEVEMATAANLTSFVNSFRAYLTTVGLLVGSLTLDQCKKLYENITSFYGGTGFNLDSVEFPAAYTVSPPSEFATAEIVDRRATLERASINSAVYDVIPLGTTCDLVSTDIANYTQGCSNDTKKRHSLVSELKAIVHFACYRQLRTVEQLGFLVDCSVTKSAGQYLFTVYIVSPFYNVTYVESRIQAFLANFSQTGINATAQSQVANGRGSFNAHANWLFHEILIGQLQWFDQLDEITDQDLITFFSDALKKPWLSIQIYSEANPVPATGPGIIQEDGVDAWLANQTSLRQERVHYGI